MEAALIVELQIFIDDLILPGTTNMREMLIDGTAEKIGKHMGIHLLDGNNQEVARSRKSCDSSINGASFIIWNGVATNFEV